MMKVALLISITVLLIALTIISIRERNFWEAAVWFGGAVIYFGLIGTYWNAIHQ